MKATPRSKGPAGGEWFVISVMVLVAAAGGFLGQQHLAALRTQVTLAGRTDTPRATGSEAPGRSEPGVVVDSRASEPATAAAPAAPEKPLAPQEIRNASLATVAKLMSGRTVMSSTVMSPAAMAMGRGGPGAVYQPDKDGKFPDRFAQLFNLNEQELASLNELSVATKQQVDQLAVANTKVVPVDNGYTFETAPAAGAEQIRDQYLAALRSTLGEDRYHAFAQLNGEVDYTAMIEQRKAEAAARGVALPPAALVPPTRATGPALFFGSFGLDTKTVTLTKEGNVYRYNYRMGNGGGSGSAQNVDQAKALLGSAAGLMPEGF